MISCEQSYHPSLFHLNIQSLQNMVELSTLLTTLDIKFSIVGVDIDGYNFVYRNRPVRSDGGVGLYVSDNLDCRICIDIYAEEDEMMEALFIEIIRPHEKNVIVGIIY